jgi:hypothetical protein
VVRGGEYCFMPGLNALKWLASLGDGANFDNDTRLLFASTFDGDWDVYINDFAARIPDGMM